VDPRFWVILSACLAIAPAGAAQEAIQPTDAGSQASVKPAGPSNHARGAVTPKILRHAQRIVDRHDRNRDGRLNADEWKSLPGNPGAADVDADGRLSVEEIAQRIADFGHHRTIRLMPPDLAAERPATANVLPERGNRMEPSIVRPRENGDATTDSPRSRRYVRAKTNDAGAAPAWFDERDADGDGQLTLAEYAPKAGKVEVGEFTKFDRDSDGVVTMTEIALSAKAQPSDTPDAKAESAATEPMTTAPMDDVELMP
jgi:hypothetical protein